MIKKRGKTMKKTICLLLALVFLAFSLSSCSKPVNFIGVEPLCLAELDGEMYFLSYYISKNYKIDFDNKTMSLVENEEIAKLNHIRCCRVA